MSNGRQERGHQDVAKTKNGRVTQVTAATTLELHENVVEIATIASSFALTLPNVSQAEGKIFTIHLIDANSNAVTLQDQDESVDWSDRTLDADADGIALLASGGKWWVLTNDIA